MSMNGDPNIGMYGFSTNKYLIIGDVVKEPIISNSLAAEIFKVTVMGTDFAGIFIAGNSKGAIISKFAHNYGTKSNFRNVLEIDTEFTAIGNLILMNDNGIIISPLLKDKKEEIENHFKLQSALTTIAGLDNVGNLAVVNNMGCLTHPEITESEKNIIEKTLGVKSDIGTVSHGSPYVRSGIIANDNGIIISETSTGHEIGRAEQALGFLEKA